MSAIMKNFISKKMTSEAAIFELYLAARPCLIMWHHSIRLEIWRQGKKPVTYLATFPRSTVCIFPRDYPLHSCHFRSLEHVWLKITELSKAINLVPRILSLLSRSRKRTLGTRLESHLDKISRTEWRHESAAWLLGIAENGGNEVEFWLKLRWASNISARVFTSVDKKCTFFGVTS